MFFFCSSGVKWYWPLSVSLLRSWSLLIFAVVPFGFDRPCNCGSVSLTAYIYGMVRDIWVENLRCPHCRKTGAARDSAVDEYSWDVQMNSVPEGFKVIRSGDVSNFYCASCDRPVEP